MSVQGGSPLEYALAAMSLASWVRILAGRTVAYRLGAPDFDTLQDVLDTHEAGNQTREGGKPFSLTPRMATRANPIHSAPTT